jgi:hypothetical protein
VIAAVASQLPPDYEAAARHVVEVLRGEAIKYLPAGRLPDIRLESVAFAQVTDPANGQPGFEGVWRNHINERVGKLVFNSDGSFFAEFDVCVRHPRKPDFFVEAVTAWGRGGNVRAEARLLPIL